MGSNCCSPGFVNSRGQVVFFKTDKLTEHFFRVFKVGCSFCGFVYDALENDVPGGVAPLVRMGTMSAKLAGLDVEESQWTTLRACHEQLFHYLIGEELPTKDPESLHFAKVAHTL